MATLADLRIVLQSVNDWESDPVFASQPDGSADPGDMATEEEDSSEAGELSSESDFGDV